MYSSWVLCHKRPGVSVPACTTWSSTGHHTVGTFATRVITDGSPRRSAPIARLRRAAMTLVSGTRVGSKWNCSPTRCVVTKNQCRNLIASFLLLFRLAARGEDFRGHITAELSLFVVLLGQDRGDKDDDRARPGKCRRR